MKTDKNQTSEIRNWGGEKENRTKKGRVLRRTKSKRRKHKVVKKTWNGQNRRERKMEGKKVEKRRKCEQRKRKKYGQCKAKNGE